MQHKISIIVPIYKVEAYLHQCIESIIHQTYTNLEIILIDDGSPDNSGKICDAYAIKDNRIIVIHKKNGGLSDARNAGIDIATGNYIGFVDSDDWIKKDMYENLYKNLIENKADISICGHYNAYKKLNTSYNSKNEKMVLNAEEAIKLSFNGDIFTVCAWSKLYRNYLFGDIRYPFGKLCEDAFVIVDIFDKANKIVVDTTPKYYYRQRKSSIMNATFNPKSTDKIEAFEYNLKIISEKYPNIVHSAKARLLSDNFSLLNEIIFCKQFTKIPEYKKVLLTLRRNVFFILKSELFTRNVKMKMIALKINVLLYKWIIILNSKRKKNREKILFD